MGFDAGSAWLLNRNISQLHLVNQMNIYSNDSTVRLIHSYLLCFSVHADVYYLMWLVYLLVN